MKPDYFLGIDTSNYTTSAAIINADGEVVLNAKRPLAVASGTRGLRQSDAVFAHVKNMPSLMQEVKERMGDGRLAAIGVSRTPRREDGSYMPCFLSGVAAAEAAAAAAGVPLYYFSHQCGHVAAAILSSSRYDLFDKRFGAFHVSGGTTELLLVSAFDNSGFTVERLGGTADLNAGQLVDRTGVMMGLPFPAGPSLEELAAACQHRVPRPRISVRGLTANFSGAENQVAKLYADTEDKSLCAAFVLDFIAASLKALTLAFLEKMGDMPLLYGGGVMSNRRIRSALAPLGDTAFAEPQFSADNAAGIALLCRRRYGGARD